MKAFVFICLVALACAQPPPPPPPPPPGGRPSVTEDLIRAQQELTISHGWSEIFLVDNRQILSDYIARIETVALDEFMGAYAAIKNTGIDTRAAMEEFETSFCADRVRERWELQVTRYGQRLSQCLGSTYGYLLDFTNILNRLHDESREYTNQIPNTSTNILSTIDIFTGRDNLRFYINDALRDLYFRALNLHAEFEEFVNGISIDLDLLLEEYTECYRTLPAAFETESANDLEAMRL
ncbi:CLUMA_CG009648, isoform A [Clunio marinus]|uniref:CLUMA_CG009648, isoform A n=1 Tax=Clunio marinus TaxID=568069 RepID=A0A1J1I7G3_9DIPT|nr:CLUMA_CG009648, isoform A [Clunio marinus]